MDTSMTTQSEIQIQNLIDVWEHELDCLGPFASHEALAAHLAKAPDEAPNRKYLSEILAKTDMENHVRHVKAFVEGIIPISNDPFWSTGARMILVACILKHIAENGENWGEREQVTIMIPPPSEWGQMARDYYPPAQQFTASIDSESKIAQSVLISLNAYLNRSNLLAQ